MKVSELLFKWKLYIAVLYTATKQKPFLKFGII